MNNSLLSTLEGLSLPINIQYNVLSFRTNKRTQPWATWDLRADQQDCLYQESTCSTSAAGPGQRRWLWNRCNQVWRKWATGPQQLQVAPRLLEAGVATPPEVSLTDLGHHSWAGVRVAMGRGPWVSWMLLGLDWRHTDHSFCFLEL